MTSADWDNIKSAANSYNEDGTFVAFWGFEWTSDTTDWAGPSTLLAKGHITIINSTEPGECGCGVPEGTCDTSDEMLSSLALPQMVLEEDRRYSWRDAREPWVYR